MENTYTQIQELNLIPYGGTPEIKEQSGQKYLYNQNVWAAGRPELLGGIQAEAVHHLIQWALFGKRG